MKVRVEKEIGGKTFAIETGLLAKQSAGACLVQYADTVVLAATASGPPRPGIDFFPLTCDYRERTAAAGKFPGGFIKREGRPTIKETLTSRLMDRPIRPLFPEWFHDEVQIQAFVLASDRQHDPDVLAMNGASASLRTASRRASQGRHSGWSFPSRSLDVVATGRVTGPGAPGASGFTGDSPPGPGDASRVPGDRAVGGTPSCGGTLRR